MPEADSEDLIAKAFDGLESIINMTAAMDRQWAVRKTLMALAWATKTPYDDWFVRTLENVSDALATNQDAIKPTMEYLERTARGLFAGEGDPVPAEVIKSVGEEAFYDFADKLKAA